MRSPSAIGITSFIFIACLGLPVAQAVDVFHSAQAHHRFNETLKHFSSEEEQARLEHEDVLVDVYNRKYLLGDLWGLREDMADDGIAFNLSFALNLAGNPTGGRAQGFTQLNSTGIDFGADMGKLVGLDGLSFFASMSIRSGTSLSISKIQNVINVQQLFGNESYRLVNLYFEQVLLDEHIGLKAGRIAQFDDFSHAGAFGYYMNNAFDGQPVGFFFMGPFTAYPVTTWGALARGGVLTGDESGIYSMLGVYGASSTQANLGNHGTDFTFNFDRGANVMGEIGYKHDWTKDTDGNPGKYAVGAWVFTGPFPSLSGGTASSTGGFYYLLHQNVWREGEAPSSGDKDSLSARDIWSTADDFLDSVQGLYFWSTGQFSANTDVAQADFFFSAGAYYRGLIPGRDTDVLSIGMAYLNFSDEWAASQARAGLRQQDYEVELELSYRYSVTEYFYLQPNLQGILNPGGTGQLPDAFVIGLQLQVDF